MSSGDSQARRRAGSLIALHVAIVAHVAHWVFARTTLTPLEPSEIMQTFGQGLVNAGAGEQDRRDLQAVSRRGPRVVLRPGGAMRL